MSEDLDSRLQKRLEAAVSDNAGAAQLLAGHRELLDRVCQSMIDTMSQFTLSTSPSETELRETAYHTAKAVELLRQTIERMAAQHNGVSGL